MNFHWISIEFPIISKEIKKTSPQFKENPIKKEIVKPNAFVIEMENAKNAKVSADEKLSSDGFDKEKKNSEDIYYVEKRYCTVCNVEQPLRSKHCKDCQRCVAMYDHHCPWTGFST